MTDFGTQQINAGTVSNPEGVLLMEAKDNHVDQSKYTTLYVYHMIQRRL